jgi:hypothetical protein
MSGESARTGSAISIATKTIAFRMFAAPGTLLDYRPPMPDVDKLAPADPSDLAAALAYALRYQGRKRVHNANDIMLEIVAKRLEHSERSGFVVMKRVAEIGAAALRRGVDGLTTAL